jgi:hypothetical protein
MRVLLDEEAGRTTVLQIAQACAVHDFLFLFCKHVCEDEVAGYHAFGFECIRIFFLAKAYERHPAKEKVFFTSLNFGTNSYFLSRQ